MKIDNRSLNEDKYFINKFTTNCGNKSDFEFFIQNQCSIEAVKYPFLSKSQIKNRIMTVWKKKNVPVPKFKRNPDNAAKECTSRKNMKANHNVKEAKFPAKKSLVPLKVDFISSSSNGALKSNSTGTRRKRRVSFNKELYIRYRTTSEESSSSTLKDKGNFKQYGRPKFYKSQWDDNFNKLLNKNCTWSYRSPKTTHSSNNMEVPKASLSISRTLLDEEPENKCDTTNVKQLIKRKNDISYTSDVTDLKNSLQRDDENGIVDFAKIEAYLETNNEISNEETVCENIKTIQLESTPCLKKAEEKIIHALNESTISGNTSSDEEILQTRFPVQSKSYEDECNSFISSASFSDKENFEKKDSEIKKNPIIIKAEDYNKKLSIDYNTANSDSEVKKAEKSKHQEIATDITSYNSLNVEADNSYVETESSYMKNSIKNTNEDLNFKKRKGENEVSLQHTMKTTVNETTFDKKIKKIDDISADTVIEQFFDGSFDISTLIPEKKSAMNNGEKTITKQKQLLQDKCSEKKYKDKGHKNSNYKNRKYDLSDKSTESEHKYYNGNNDTPFSGSTDISTSHLKRKISGKYTKHSLLQGKYSPSKEEKYKDKVHKSSNYKKKKFGSFNDSNETEHKELNDNDEPFFDSTDISTSHLKRKISGKHTENSKKARTVTKTNKNDKTDINLEILNNYNSKARSENRNFKANSQHKHMNNQSQYSNKQTIFINDFDIQEKKKSKAKSNTAKSKSLKNEKIIKDFSYHTNPIEKSKSLRKSSLVATKRIKEIEKFENVDSSEDTPFDSDNAWFDSKLKVEDMFKNRFKDTKVNQKYKTKDNSLVALKKNNKRENVDNYDEIVLDSHNSFFDSQFENIEDSFKSIFKNTKIYQKYSIDNKQDKDNIDIIDITSTDSFQVCSNKKENIRITKSNKKHNKKFEDDTFDVCHIGAKWQLKIGNKMTSKYFNSETNQDFFIEGNEDTYENNQNNRRKMSNECQRKNVRTEKLLDCIKNIDKNTSCKSDTVNIMNYGAVTRSKKRTWEALENELLGEPCNASFSNEGIKTVLLKEQSARKRNMKEADLYPISDKSVMQTVSMLNRKSKYDKKNKIQSKERRYSQTSTDNVQSKSNAYNQNIQSKEIVAYKTNNILEKTIAAMERCTGKFLAPQKNFAEKKSGLELNDTIDEITIDQEAEFHSNMTIKTNKNEQYYKNEIVAFVKQSSFKKKANLLGKNSRGSFSEAGHLVKQRMVTESYLMKNNAEENLETESKALIPLSEKKQTDPWSRLIEKLNLNGNNEKKSKNISNEEPHRKSLECHENSKKYTNAHKNSVGEMQLVMDLDEGETFKQDKKSEIGILKQHIFEETPALSNDTAICSHLYAENCFANAIELTKNNGNTELHNKLMPERIEKTIVKKITTKKEQIFQVKKRNKSPKFKLQVENGGIKLKRCTKSLSSSSKESVKRKNTKREDNKKFLKNQPISEKEKYKKYLYDLFNKKDSLLKEKLKSKKKPESVNEENSIAKNPDENKNMEQTKMINNLIGKNEDDVFSISSSDSEGGSEKHPGAGLICDMFDE